MYNLDAGLNHDVFENVAHSLQTRAMSPERNNANKRVAAWRGWLLKQINPRIGIATAQPYLSTPANAAAEPLQV